jgi:hypothetical protein
MVRRRLLRRASLRFSCLKAKAGGKGIRTPGLLIANETLYQLSYTPEIVEKPPLNVQNLVWISTGTPPVLPPPMIFGELISVQTARTWILLSRFLTDWHNSRRDSAFIGFRAGKQTD